jgi:hypothetical protein
MRPCRDLHPAPPPRPSASSVEHWCALRRPGALVLLLLGTQAAGCSTRGGLGGPRPLRDSPRGPGRLPAGTPGCHNALPGRCGCKTAAEGQACASCFSAAWASMPISARSGQHQATSGQTLLQWLCVGRNAGARGNCSRLGRRFSLGITAGANAQGDRPTAAAARHMTPHANAPRHGQMLCLQASHAMPLPGLRSVQLHPNSCTLRSGEHVACQLRCAMES